MLKLFPSAGRCLQRLLCNYGSDNPWNPLKKGLLLVHRLSSSIPRQTLVGRCTASNRVSSYSPWPLGSLRCFSHNKTCEDEDGISSSPCLMCDNCFRPQQLNKLAVAGQKTVTLNFPEDVASHELLGSSSPSWIAVTNKFNGDIVLMNPFTEKIGWDLQQPSPKMIHRLDHTVDESDQRTFKYLVESLGDILLVVKYLGPPTRPPSKTQGFDVFKLDFQQQTMERVECLGDRVLFLCNYSFSVSAQDFPELNPNSIYFTHDDEEYWPGMYTIDGYTLEYRGGENREDYDIGFYCLEDHSITTLYDMEICLHCLRSPGYWVIPASIYVN
ncbi:hypothetical protein FH972_016450 [Carpinus fangiana]|uniref:KIB1-4 beta-propeller domain-containing protein n=1 Tax=Carpinus fangiana TaxID=176857 RepID=A0A5N6RG66_9ROSI|nr:hypothetical protein FH972_016450 [Carpinus fangiana]